MHSGNAHTDELISFNIILDQYINRVKQAGINQEKEG